MFVCFGSCTDRFFGCAISSPVAHKHACGKINANIQQEKDVQENIDWQGWYGITRFVQPVKNDYGRSHNGSVQEKDRGDHNPRNAEWR